MKTFKSERAAKMAYTKAERARQDKQREGALAFHAKNDIFRTAGSMPVEQLRAFNQTIERCEREAAELFEKMRAIYDAAKAQGIWINSWHFSHNPTRDLIANNID